MDRNSEELKLLFIEEELSQHGEWLCDVLSEAIEKRKLIESGELQGSVNYSSFKSGENPGLRVSFVKYGRFLDIEGYKKKKHTVDTNREIWGIRQNRVRKKNTQWYARNMYGGLNRLISRIMYGLTDAEVERLKGILNNRKNNG